MNKYVLVVRRDILLYLLAEDPLPSIQENNYRLFHNTYIYIDLIHLKKFDIIKLRTNDQHIRFLKVKTI